MDTGTVVNHSICNINHRNGQSADVPGSAQPSDLLHGCTGRRYGGLQAGGEATVIQGDVNINCTHPHGGSEEGGFRALFKSKTSGDTDPLHKARNPGPPRAHSLGCPCTLPFPTPFLARATPSFTGLHDIEDSAPSSVNWKAEFEAEATGVRIEITDAGIGGSSRQWPWTDGAEVSVEVRKSDRIRRLKITKATSTVLWLPETRVRVTLVGDSVVAQFSNCNKLQSPGPYATDNGRRKSVLAYDPEAANVHFNISFASVEDATNFSRILLCRPLAGGATDQVLQKVGNCTFMHQNHDISEGEPIDITLVWKQETDPEGKTYEVHDKVSFSDILDLDMSLADQHVRLSFGYMNRLQYHPARNRPTLPQNVKRTPDGGPDSVTFEGAESPTSRLELVTPSTDLEIQQFLKCFAGNQISWKFEAMFLQRKIKISSFSNALLRVLFGSKEYLTQITLWSNDDKLRILMRAVDPDGTNDLRRHPPRWFAITLEKNGVSPVAHLKQHGGIVLTVVKVNYKNNSH
ncbi:MAG: hypothetical protein Q9198_004700, partial [Flavoplaca austrocitrina]